MIDVLLLAGEKVFGLDYKLPENLKNKSREKSKLALDIYIGRIREYIGAYAVLLGGVDTIAFTGRVGAGSPVIREKVLEGLENAFGKYEIKVVEPDEELAMAKLVASL
jgi:acetate kinase